jgi:hypothetical protein
VRTERYGNRLQNTLTVLQNVIVPEAKNAPSALVQSFVPHNVVARAPVLSAVGFDHEARLDTSEIDDVGRDRMLPSKTPTELVVPQHIPSSFSASVVSRRKRRARPIIVGPPRILPPPLPMWNPAFHRRSKLSKPPP